MSVDAYIVAAGGANFGSLREACRRVGVTADVGDDASRIARATHVILPGVGAAGHAMRALRERSLDRALRALSRPLLGICLGMQLLFDRSDEDDAEGLGVLPGRVQRLPPAPSWPHMGWNTLDHRAENPLLDGIDGEDWFYFVHGYAAPIADATLATTRHGVPFSAAVAKDRAYGVQFHPEKSGAAGRRVLANFFGVA